VAEAYHPACRKTRPLEPEASEDLRWQAIAPPFDMHRIGLVISLSGPKSHVSGAIFHVAEGNNNEIFDKLSAMAGTAPAALSSVTL